MIETSHHRSVVSLLFTFMCCVVCHAQSSSVEERMDDIKLEGKCWYGEGVAKTREEAHEKAVTDLLSQLSQNDIHKFDRENIKPLLSEMHYNQKEHVTVFVYATKEKLQTAQVQHKPTYTPAPNFQQAETSGQQPQPAVEQASQPQPASQPQNIASGATTSTEATPATWDELPSEMRIYLNILSPRSKSAKNVLRHLASSREFGDIQVFKHQNGTPYPKDMFVLFFQGDTSMAVLSPDTGNGRINVNSKTTDSCENYQGCEAVQFKMNKK